MNVANDGPATARAVLRDDRAVAGLGMFERYLSVWVTLAIIAGIALGHLLPDPFQAIAAAEVAKINLPVAVLIWLMIIPMLLKIDLGALHQVGALARHRDHAVHQLGGQAILDGAARLAVCRLAVSCLAAGRADHSYIAGLIILAAAPCTAMVFVWSNLCGGEPHFTLSQVALNDSIMVFAFAPIVGLLLGLSSIVVPQQTLVISVVLFIVVRSSSRNCGATRCLAGGEQLATK
ncbi:MAG: hypothetical protein U1E43_03135 [Rhodospirillales bacterium]